MVKDKQKYSISQCYIVPTEISDVQHKSECCPKYGDRYPIFCAPMSTITDENNYFTWESFGFNPILPRNIQYSARIDFFENSRWTAFGLNEFEEFINSEDWKLTEGKTYYACIDIANGHMEHLYEVIDSAKELAKSKGCHLIVMTGNVANPETYRWICENADVDYIRVCIGTGDVCTTTPSTGIHYPSASLISECAAIRNDIEIDMEEYHQFTRCLPKIVCDGGLHSFSDINKALALGADYVMLGSVLATMDESVACSVYDKYNVNITYYGMSTHKAQSLINKALKKPKPMVYKVEEGTDKVLDKTGSCRQWVEKFDAYLRSAMSYTGCRTLEEFTSGYVDVVYQK